MYSHKHYYTRYIDTIYIQQENIYIMLILSVLYYNFEDENMKLNEVHSTHTHSPDVGSSRSTRGGLANNAIAVDSLRLFPPE